MAFKIWETIKTQTQCDLYRLLEEVETTDLMEVVKLAREKYPGAKVRITSDKVTNANEPDEREPTKELERNS